MPVSFLICARFPVCEILFFSISDHFSGASVSISSLKYSEIWPKSGDIAKMEAYGLPSQNGANGGAGPEFSDALARARQVRVALVAIGTQCFVAMSRRVVTFSGTGSFLLNLTLPF